MTDLPAPSYFRYTISLVLGLPVIDSSLYAKPRIVPFLRRIVRIASLFSDRVSGLPGIIKSAWLCRDDFALRIHVSRLERVAIFNIKESLL